jgi:flagellar biosynthesis protein FlhF
MKIKRFFAADIRQAMRMVKEELGADAVIMSNRTVDGGIEIVAARDFDEQSIHNKLQDQLPEQQTPGHNAKKIALPNFDAAKKRLQLLESQRKDNHRKQGTTVFMPEQLVRAHRFPTDSDTFASPSSRRNTDQYVGYAEKVQLREKPETATPKVNSPTVKEDPFKSLKPLEKPASLSDKLLMDMSKELKYLRTAMDTKLSNIGWAHSSQATPVRADLLQRLAGMSISKRLSVMIANHFADHTDPELVFLKVQEMLAKVLPIAEDSLLETGGIIALVGPTGVGKTTTIAKLAAKFILKHGARQVALVTTDNYRIGAHEQINTYGRILDVPVRVASSAGELRNLINGFSDKRLILIDTAGMSQRDMKLVEQINTLQENGLSIKSYLVMSAATEYKAMNAIIKAFSVFDPQASILTKLDEAVTIGSAISSIIEHNLPLSFIADGQQVPEDIHSPHARSLIEHCVAELNNAENDFNDNFDYGPWVANGYAQAV